MKELRDYTRLQPPRGRDGSPAEPGDPEFCLFGMSDEESSQEGEEEDGVFAPGFVRTRGCVGTGLACEEMVRQVSIAPSSGTIRKIQEP